MTEQNPGNAASLNTEDFFREWWIASYGMHPGKHAIMTHVQFAEDFAKKLVETLKNETP